MFRLATLYVLLGVICLGSADSAEPLLELTVGGTTFTGKSLGHDDETCWIAELDGRVARVPLQKVTSYRKLAEVFRGVTSVDLRSQLRREFGGEWEVVSTRHYLVCAPRGRGQLFARTFEDLYGNFRSYFSRRGFQLPQPDFPMIAVIYPTPDEFAANCKKDSVPFLPGLRGYYHRLSNRVSLFEGTEDRLALAPPASGDHTDPIAARLTIPAGGRRASAAVLLRSAEVSDTRCLNWESLSISSVRPEQNLTALRLTETPGVLPFVSFDRPWDASIQSDLRNTIVHEATHQAAFNLGLHSRIGENPKWITEGLATMFEADGARQNKGSAPPQERINLERFAWFSAYARKSRPPKSLARFVMDDRMFQDAPLDAYAQAWALMFYLAETRSSQLTKFLNAVSSRPWLEAYTAEKRLADFQSAFGDDIDRLEVAFLRFMDDLQ
jgi:hypothetical protein